MQAKGGKGKEYCYREKNRGMFFEMKWSGVS